MRLGVLLGAVIVGLLACATAFIPLALRGHARSALPQPAVTTSVWSIPIRGGLPHLVTQLRGQYDFPVPSADGRSLLVLKPTTAGPTSIWSLPLEGGTPRRVGRTPVFSSPAWSPDRKRLASTFGATGVLEIRDLHGRVVRTIARRRGLGGFALPSWSRDFIAFEHQSSTAARWRIDLEVWHATGGLSWHVRGMPFPLSPVALAPDGRHVAVVIRHSLYVVTPHSRRRLAFAALNDRAPSWTPDGRSLVYFDNAQRLVVQDVHRRARHVIARGRIGDASLSADGNTVYVVGSKPAVSIPK